MKLGDTFWIRPQVNGQWAIGYNNCPLYWRGDAGSRKNAEFRCGKLIKDVFWIKKVVKDEKPHYNDLVEAFVTKAEDAAVKAEGGIQGIQQDEELDTSQIEDSFEVNENDVPNYKKETKENVHFRDDKSTPINPNDEEETKESVHFHDDKSTPINPNDEGEVQAIQQDQELDTPINQNDPGERCTKCDGHKFSTGCGCMHGRCWTYCTYRYGGVVRRSHKHCYSNGQYRWVGNGVKHIKKCSNHSQCCKEWKCASRCRMGK
jgi:hypothetical protein